MSNPATVDEYYRKLEQILSEALLPDKEPVNPALKAIHDPMWGSQLYYPWEVALIDTPLCQRLRQIYQLGTAYLTYPSAVHTRFSHTLGVAALAGRLIDRLREKAEIYKGDECPITKKDVYTVRCAGLLHDVGHCFFSHASEKILEPIIAPIRKTVFTNINPKPHEFLSYLIVSSEYFQAFWKKHIVGLFPIESEAPDPVVIAKLIVGLAPSEEKRYLRDIIYGPFDVDKLEYLYRDARTTGLEVSYDIERYFYKIKLVKKPATQSWILAMDQGGVRAVEQIIFSKMMLFSFVYHHQKILSSDILVSELINELLVESAKGNLRVDHPLDFLRYTDADIFTSIVSGPTQKFNRIREKIFKRDLPKRCFVLNKEFVNDLDIDGDVKTGWRALTAKLRGLPEEVNMVRNEIVALIKECPGCADFSIEDLYVTLPKVPQMDEPATAPVVGADQKLQSMGDFFDFEGWKTTYNLKKLRGYFFVSLPYTEIACAIIEKYLRDKYKLSFSANAKIEAKIKSIPS